MRRPSPRTILLLLLAGAFVLRVAMAFGVQSILDHVLHRQFVIEGDAAGYWELGRRMATGEEYSLYDPPRRVLRMPGFPAIVAAGMTLADAIGLSERKFLVCRLLLALVASAGCWGVFLLGKTLCDDRTGLWAAALTAVSPAVVGFSVLILSETAFGVLLTLNLWCLARLIRGAPGERSAGLSPRCVRLAWAVAVGVTGAAACYVRPSWLLAVPFFTCVVTWFVSDWKRGLICGTIATTAMMLALLPWAARNRTVTGHWTFTTLWVGPSLYDGLNPQATGDSDMRFFDEENLMAFMTEREVDQEYRRRAWEFTRQNPGRALQLAAIKLGRFWNPFPNAEQFSRWWMRWPLALFFLAAVALAVFSLRRRNREISDGDQRAFAKSKNRILTNSATSVNAARSPTIAATNVALWAICAGPLLYFSAIHMLFVGSIRYRLPAEYPAYVLSAAGIVRLLDRGRGKGLSEMHSEPAS